EGAGDARRFVSMVGRPTHRGVVGREDEDRCCRTGMREKDIEWVASLLVTGPGRPSRRLESRDPPVLTGLLRDSNLAACPDRLPPGPGRPEGPDGVGRHRGKTA